jgi:uncharacterized coiled-coil DUF342 family protein
MARIPNEVNEAAELRRRLAEIAKKQLSGLQKQLNEHDEKHMGLYAERDELNEQINELLARRDELARRIAKEHVEEHVRLAAAVSQAARDSGGRSLADSPS